MPVSLTVDDHDQEVFPLSIRTDDCQFQVMATAGLSVREVLDCTEIRVRAACGGMGVCGACLVKVVEGDFRPPTVVERQKILPEDLQAGYRLACQLKARGPGAIYIEHPAPCSQWKSIGHHAIPIRLSGNDAIGEHPYGIAVDLGTTHIRLSLWNRQTGSLIANRVGINPQVSFGADVLTRLDANRLSAEKYQGLCQEARRAIIDGVRDMLSRDIGEITAILAQIGKVAIVGNTVMLMLVCGGDSNAMYELQNWHRALVLELHDLPAWRQQWRMPNAELCISQPLAGFVGSDLLADLLAIDMIRQPHPVLLVDLGTNTEIALWDGTAVWVTSVPGGPAFEGVGMRNGLPAEQGAIFKISKQADGWRCKTLGNTPIRGLCASGFIDAMALLLEEGQLKPSGRFAQPVACQGYRLDPRHRRSAIFASDIDIFQRAKASTAAAMAQLLKFAGMRFDQVHTLWICGSLGQHIDFAHAVEIGLLPPIAPERMRCLPNASLAGCERLLLQPDADAQLSAIRALAKPVNLGGIEEYEELFIEHLRLQPMQCKVHP